MKKKSSTAGARFPLLGYRPDIDGLRAVAVLAVVAFHAFPERVRGGFAGVDVFFVISGLLISNQILHRLERGDFRLSDFYARRVRRIFPALIVVLAACGVLGWFALFSGEYTQLGKHIASGAAFLSNFVLWRESGYFDTSSQLKPLLHLWSLGVEEQFYLLWPVTLLLSFRFRWNALRVVIAILIASLAFNLYWVNRDASGAFYLPFTRFWELMTGALLACAVFSRVSRRFGEAMSIAGLMLVGVGFVWLRDTLAYPGVWAIVPTLGTALVLQAGPDAWINRRVLAVRPLVWIGLISYPLYLWHWPLLSFGEIVQAGALSTQARLSLILASFVLASLTYLLIERPIRFGSRTPGVAFAAVAALIVVGGAGWTVYESKGVESRSANRSGNFARDIAVPGSTYTSDGSCGAVGLEQIQNEVCLASGRDPQILVIGDSHAIAMNAAPFLKVVPVRTLLVAAHSCLPFVDYVSHSASETKADKICTDVAWQVLGAARSHREMKDVVIMTRGPIYFSGKAFGIEEQDPTRNNWQIEAVKPNDEGVNSLERFRYGFSRLLAALEGFGKNVTFVIDVPELGIDPHTCVPERPLSFLPAVVSPCVVARTIVDKRQADYRKVVQLLAEEHPKMKVFDPLPLFCDDAWCHGKDDAHLFYYDNNHLSVAGSARLWNALLAELKFHAAALPVQAVFGQELTDREVDFVALFGS